MKKNQIILLFLILMQSVTQPADFFQWNWDHFFDGLRPWIYMGGALLIGSKASHLYYHVWNMDPEGSLKRMEERLRDDKFWQSVCNGNEEEIKKGKESIQKDIDKFKKIILEKEEKKKKEEETGQGSHNPFCRERIYGFFFLKNMIKNPNYNRLIQQHMVENIQPRALARPPLSRYPHTSFLFNTLQTVSTRYHNLKQIKKDYVQKLSSKMNNTIDYPLWSL